MRHIPKSLKDPIRKAHSVRSSVVVTIDPSHVKRLKINSMTFFVQRPIHNGILLEIKRLQDSKDELKEDENKMRNVVDGESFPGPTIDYILAQTCS